MARTIPNGENCKVKTLNLLSKKKIPFYTSRAWKLVIRGTVTPTGTVQARSLAQIEKSLSKPQ
jgi:hypothetical protein